MTDVRLLAVGGFMAELAAVVAADFSTDLGRVCAESLIDPVFIRVEISQVLKREISFRNQTFYMHVGTMRPIGAKPNTKIPTQKRLLRRHLKRKNSLLRLIRLMTHLTLIAGFAEA